MELADHEEGYLRRNRTHVQGPKDRLHRSPQQSSPFTCVDMANSSSQHYEQLGEKYGKSAEVTVRSRRGSTPVLRNWIPAGVMMDEVWLETRMPTKEGKHKNAATTQNQSAYFEDYDLTLEDVARKKRDSQKASRMSKRDRLSRQRTQILSPLVLNYHDHDVQRFNHEVEKSLFSLEQPFDEEGGFSGDDFPLKLDSIHAERSLSKHTTDAISRPLSTMQMQGSQQEADFLEYEVFDLPTIPYYKSRNHIHTKNQASQHDRALQFDSAAYYEHSKSSLKAQPNLSMPGHSPALFTAVEDCNRSDVFPCSSVDESMGELHGELELEAFSESVGNRAETLTGLRDIDVLQLAVPKVGKDLALCDDKPRNLSQKYRPKAMEELVGQNIVAQALSSAILKSKIAPVYLFQGSRGTGKTSAARIFAAALICESSEGKQRPCGACKQCIEVATGNCSEVKEVDAASNNGIERVKMLLDENLSAPLSSRYKVFIIDECHVLTTETWNALLKVLEEPPTNVVFILTTTDADQLPRTALSRCQRFPFAKIKDSEIVKRLQKVADLENLKVGVETLQLIAARSDGSLRDAEMTLDQLSLLGEEVNPSTVYELVGSASDERMLSLLDSALMADTVGTVRRVKELIDSGVEPLSLMSRLATLIMDILAGSYPFSDAERKGFFQKENFSQEKLEMLRMAMKTLSEAEKQLRVSTERATWLTAALLQLGPDRSFIRARSYPGSSVTQSPMTLDENDTGDFELGSSTKEALECDAAQSDLPTSKLQLNAKDSNQHTSSMSQDTPWSINERALRKSLTAANQTSVQTLKKAHVGHGLLEEPLDYRIGEKALTPSKLDEIWYAVVERCQPLPLRQMLYSHGKLVSILMSEVDAVVYLEISNQDHKFWFEKSQTHIADVFGTVLGSPVEIQISLASLSKGDENVRRHEMQNAHPYSPSLVQGDSVMVGARKQHSAALDGVLANGNSYMRDLDYDALYGDRERVLDGGENMPPGSDEAAIPLNEVRPNHGNVAQSYYIDGRRSCDAGLQQRIQNRTKLVGDQLPIRNGIKSLPSSGANSPNGTECTSIGAPKATMTNRLQSRHDVNREAFEQAKDSLEANSNVAAASQRKHKLKGAAGSFARLFQGKAGKQGTDSSTSNQKF